MIDWERGITELVQPWLAKLDPAHAEAFARSVGSWPPFADTVDSLRYFERHYRLAILSNVDNASLGETLKLLQVSFDLTVSAQDAKSYKPSLAELVARHKTQVK